MTTTARKFPMDGYTDTCNGFAGKAHGTDEELTNGLCAACAAVLDRFVTATRDQADMSARQVIAQRCVCGKRGHQHGTKYSTCNCCFAD